MVTYTAMPGCNSYRLVTVDPPVAAITGIVNLCPGNSMALANATPGGTWSSSNVYKATIDPGTGITTAISAGTSTITYLISTGCYKLAHITIKPLPAPIGGPEAVLEGGTVTLTSTPAGGAWSSSDLVTATIGTGSGVVSGINAGITNITYQLPTGCMMTRDLAVVTARPDIPVASGGHTSVFSVYPNPASGKLTIEAPVTGTFTVYTIDGKKIENYAIAAGAATISLPPGLSAGIYMCQFTGDDGKTQSIRLVYEP
jgi:hypothetical protein